jgi:glycosyltransferase involved in cell wall biosynthesis
MTPPDTAHVDRMQVSVIAPAYRCADCIPELYRRLSTVLTDLGVSYEILFIDDGSPENDWGMIREICDRDRRVRGVRLSRNFGQHFAITAGLDYCQGDWVVVMDCDLQDQPEEIPKMLEKAKEGFDIVQARRCSRNDSFYRRSMSRIFVWLYNVLGDLKADNAVANFSVSSSNVISAIRRYRDRSRTFPMLLEMAGFSRTTVDVMHAPRFAGRSAYNFTRLLDVAIQLIVAQSVKPLVLSIRFGFLLAFLALVYGLVIFVRYFTLQQPVAGWTTLALLICFLGGLGFAQLGVMGLYLGRILEEVRQRPLYIVDQVLNLNENKSSDRSMLR